MEAGERSGSLITADHALDLGRDVLAVPGRIDAPGSRGTHRLLREGAALCDGVADVVLALGLEPGSDAGAGDERAAAPLPANPVERAIVEALKGTELDTDELIAATGKNVADVLAALGALELRGTVRPQGRRPTGAGGVTVATTDPERRSGVSSRTRRRQHRRRRFRRWSRGSRGALPGT